MHVIYRLKGPAFKIVQNKAYLVHLLKSIS